jgi:hypothetical protein
MVGAAGFELATYWSQTSCATRLRYAPNHAFYSQRHGGLRRGEHQLARHLDALLNVLLGDVFQ